MFDTATRRMITKLPPMARPVGGGLTTLNLPKAGLLARLWLQITGNVTVSAATPNPLGMASAIRRVRLTANSGTDVFNVSGAGYHYLLRNFHDMYFDPFSKAAVNARAVVSVAAFDVSMMIECQLNQHDPVGLIMLQNEETQLTLNVEWESDVTVGGAGTVITAGLCQPYMEFFTVPSKPEDWPPLNVLHQIIEDQQAVAGAGDFAYAWPRGNTYVQVLHGAGINQAGADSWTQARLRINQSLFVEDKNPAMCDAEYSLNHPAPRILGVVPFDFLGSDGQGAFGRSRDFINSATLTDLATVITLTGALTLYTVRRQLVPLG